MAKKWHVAYTKPRNEKKVTERLLSGGYEVYCPLVKTLKKWSDRKKMVALPMFTSYIFMRLNETERQTVVQDPGVLNFVFWQDKPAVMRDEEITAIKKIEQYGLNINVSGSFPTEGEKINIPEGVFRGMSGEVRRVDKNRISVWIDSIRSLVTFSYENV